MGVTGYTYDGQFKGAFISFGDYRQGGRFTIAHGRATDINYNYTRPMIHGMDLKGSGSNAGLISAVLSAENGKINQAINQATRGNAAAREAMINGIVDTMKQINSRPASEQEGAMKQAVGALVKQLGIKDPQDQSKIAAEIPKLLNSGININGDTAVFMQNEDWGSDQDVPVTYASYIYKKPQQWEFHAYGMTANGPVGKICKAYGFAGAYYVTPCGMYRANSSRICASSR